MKLASLIKEQMDIGDVLYKNRDQIELDFGPRTFKTLQSSLMMDDEAYVRSWLIKNGYMEEEKMPFEEGKVCESCGKIHEGSCGYTHTVGGKKLRTPGGTRGGVGEIKLSDLVTDKQKQDAEEFAAKTRQVAAKAGEEMVNFAKDVYDTPTVKRLRAYVKKEVAKLAQKLVDKYGAEKQMKIPFPEDEIEESLRNWFKKEKWVRIDTQGNIAGKCGTMPKGKATQRCLPRAKAQSLTKAQRRATARKKVRGSKKGKQFVKNTKKARVKLKK